MNPLTNMKNVLKLSERELNNLDSRVSWHDQYKNSPWIFVGGLSYDLSEGDVIAVFSQFGEIKEINMIRDKDTGKTKGYCFICFEDQRSTVLSVDNLNGIKLVGRIIRVDHVSDYKVKQEEKNKKNDTYRKGEKNEKYDKHKRDDKHKDIKNRKDDRNINDERNKKDSRSKKDSRGKKDDKTRKNDRKKKL